MQEDLELSVGIGGEKAFIASLKAMEDAVEKLGDELRELGKKSAPVKDPFKELPEKAKPAAGSIAAVNQKLSELNSKFISTGSALERSQLKVQMDALNKELKEMSGTGGGGGGIPKATSSLSTLSSTFATLGVTLGAAAVVGGVVSFGKAAITSASQYESLSISLGVLLGDASKVPSVLAEWKKFSDVTPFEPEQVNKAGKALLAFGFESEQLVPLMTKIGDVASGTGKDFNELATIYGKARVAGTLMSEDINQLTEAGIPIMEELAFVLGTTTDKVKDMASKGKITFPLFEQAFGRLTGEGGKFGGMMDKLSQSTEGILSTLKGEFDGLLREVGTAFLPIIKELAQAVIPMLQSALKAMQPYLAQIPVIFERVKAFAKPMIEPLQRIWDAFMRISDAIKPITDILFPSLGGQFESVEKKGGLITKVLEAIAWVLEGVASAVEWVNEKWAAFVENSPIIAKAVQYLVAPFTMVNEALSYMGDLLTGILGSGSESVGGLADASKKKLGDFSKYLQSSFGATSQQVVGFAKSFDMARIAGMSEADAMYEVKKAFGIYIATCDEATTSTDALGGALTDASKKAIPAAGSIAAMEAELKKLQDLFNNATTQGGRNALAVQIEDVTKKIADMKRGFELVEIQGMKLRTVTSVFDAVGASADNGLRPIATYAADADAAMNALAATMDTKWERFASAFPESASILQQGLEDLKAGFRNFGIQAAESIGYAIGSGKNAADAFKAVINSMMVEVPKLAGMVLLNAAVAAGPTPAGLALGAAGLALIGLSGLMGGIIEKNQAEKAALADSMSDLPTSATGAAGAASLGGLGGYTGASQQQAPVMVNVNAEMDGVQLGGLIKRVTTNYNKTTIKQR